MYTMSYRKKNLCANNAAIVRAPLCGPIVRAIVWPLCGPIVRAPFWNSVCEPLVVILSSLCALLVPFCTRYSIVD